MSCTKHVLGFQWEHHSWRRRVSSFEIVTGPGSNMWARAVYQEYMRCDKEDVCEECGKIRRQVSCICDMERGERCKLRCASLAEAH